MVTINLESWENPNFPQLDILENQTNEVLEAFNKCRKLELELQGDDTEIKRFNISINTLTERRAQESYKHSSYSKNVSIYVEEFSKESETVETILIILLTLLSEAKDRRESTNKLRQDYQDFLESFNNYHVIDNSNNEQVEIKNPEFAIPILSFFFSTFIFYQNMDCDPLSSNQDNACNNIPEILWRVLGQRDRNASKDKKSPNDEKEQKDEEPQKNEKPQKDVKTDEKTQKDEITQKDGELPKNEEPQKDAKTQNDEKTQKDETTQKDGKSQKDGESPKNEETSGFSLLNQINQTNQMNWIPINDANNQTSEFNQIDQTHVSQYVQYVNAIVFGILIALLIWILLRITKPTRMKDRKRKSQKRLEELSQQKNNKILEIKNKLPVIITNVDILYQFWNNQVNYITINSNNLRSVDKKEKIKIPKKIALSIKEDWRNQSNSCEKNYMRMRHLVTFNFILTE